VQQGTSQGSILGPLFFSLFINDVPIITSKNATLVLHAEDTSITITSPSSTEFSIEVSIFANINEWFKSNLLSLNLHKTHFLQFQTKYSQKLYLNITLLNKHITNTTNIKFLVLNTDKTLLWITMTVYCQG